MLLQKAIAVRKIVSKKQIISGIKGCLSILKDDQAWRRTLPPIEEMESKESLELFNEINQIYPLK